MAEDDDNLILHLLREIRAEQGEMRGAMASISERMTSFERHVEDMKESVGYALGLSVHANVAYETTGQRLDRLTELLAGLETRVGQLEKPR
jgi:hypothetical protein